MKQRRAGRVGGVVAAVTVTVTASVGVLMYPGSRGAASPLPAARPAATTTTHLSPPPESTQAPPAHGAEAPGPCVHNRQPKLVVVNIQRQHLWACAGRRTALSTPVTTGATARGDGTPRGHFAVLGRDRNSTLTTSSGSSYRVRFWIPFRLGVWGFHDASWQRIPFGSPKYKTQGSHGCVHMPLAAVRWLFRWVRYGTHVRVS